MRSHKLKKHMALEIKTNPEYAGTVVSHGIVCAKKIGDHTQSELLSLAIEGRKANNRIILRMFSNLPSMDELVKEKTSNELAEVKLNTLSKEAAPAQTSETTKK